MRVFIWNSVSNLTTNWHDGGGLVVVAHDLDDARKRISEDGRDACEAMTKGPDVVYEVIEPAEAAVFVFPDAGCC